MSRHLSLVRVYLTGGRPNFPLTETVFFCCRREKKIIGPCALLEPHRVLLRSCLGIQFRSMSIARGMAYIVMAHVVMAYIVMVLRTVRHRSAEGGTDRPTPWSIPENIEGLVEQRAGPPLARRERAVVPSTNHNYPGHLYGPELYRQ